jgi:hypothetical protein
VSLGDVATRGLRSGAHDATPRVSKPAASKRENPGHCGRNADQWYGGGTQILRFSRRGGE